MVFYYAGKLSYKPSDSVKSNTLYNICIDGYLTFATNHIIISMVKNSLYLLGLEPCYSHTNNIRKALILYIYDCFIPLEEDGLSVSSSSREGF